MSDKAAIQKIISEIQKGMHLAKCRQCACMNETLQNLCLSLPSIELKESSGLIQEVEAWLKKMESIKYSCLGCDYCFPAVATNILTSEFSFVELSSPSCGFEITGETWPPVAGEYFVLCEGVTCPVAVSTLASISLAEALANIKPRGLCIVGKTETENIGIDKVIKNTITNPAIRFLILSGQDPPGHHGGKTLLALWEKGVASDMKVIDAPGRRPILKNVSRLEVESFRRQVQVINMIGCENPELITDKIDELSKKPLSSHECRNCSQAVSPLQVPSNTPKILASEPKRLKMDKARYFVIIPGIEKKIIVVEHYAYDNKLLHIIEGENAPAVYSTIIENKWITELTILYIGGCFLLGCCGSPLLTVYLGLFGSSFLGFTKSLVAIITTLSVIIGYFWIEKKSKSCCEESGKCLD